MLELYFHGHSHKKCSTTKQKSIWGDALGLKGLFIIFLNISQKVFLTVEYVGSAVGKPDQPFRGDGPAGKGPFLLWGPGGG
jgi:hypothetical protein